MGTKRKSRKGGRPKKEGPREPNGKPQRNIHDTGTPELKARKVSLLRSDRLEISPLGILAGHGLITDAMYGAADRYRTMFYAGHPDSDRPTAPLPFLAKLTNDPSSLDIPRREPSDELYVRGRFIEMREKLTNEQQEIVHTLAIYGEWPPIIERLAHEIISHRMRWDDESGLIQGAPPSATLKKAVAAIRNALEAMLEPKSRLHLVSNKVVVSDGPTA